MYGFENAIFKYGRFSKIACFAKSVAVSRTAAASFGGGSPDWFGLMGSATQVDCTGRRFEEVPEVHGLADQSNPICSTNAFPNGVMRSLSA